MFASLSGKIKSLSFLDYPVDFKKNLFGKRILGDHKTFRGYLFGVLVGIMVAIIQYMLYQFDFFIKISFYNYNYYPILLGFLMGLGALLGDSFGAFIKRRFNIAPGRRMIVVDQITFIIGGLALSCFIFVPEIWIWIVSIVLGFVLHIVVNHLAFYLKINKNKW
jgi:CDP-2,3-bis-(O-geranylgeranyl)-sn-glycerol synthase